MVNKESEVRQTRATSSLLENAASSLNWKTT